jgi:WD40 repeat protein
MMRIAVWMEAIAGNLARNRESANSVAFDRTGQFVATGSCDDTVKVWEMSVTLPPPAAAAFQDFLNFNGSGGRMLRQKSQKK